MAMMALPVGFEPTISVLETEALSQTKLREQCLILGPFILHGDPEVRNMPVKLDILSHALPAENKTDIHRYG